MQSLRAEQKCDIAQREIEEIKDDKTRHEDESEKVVDNYKVRQHWYYILVLYTDTIIYWYYIL